MTDERVDEEWPLLGADSETHRWRIRKGCRSHVLFISLLADWPWAIAASFSRNENITKLRCLSCLQLFYVITRMLLAIVSMLTQDVVTFRRDRFDQTAPSVKLLATGETIEEIWISPGSGSKGDDKTEEISLPYDDSKPGLKLFGDVIILDLIMIILLIWVLCSKLRLLCTKRAENENLHTETVNLSSINVQSTQTENPFEDPLSQLIKAVKYMQRDKLTSALFVIIPIVYIMLSIMVSVMYLLVYFKHKQVMWPRDWEITGPLKITVITILLVGTTAIDLLYIQILLRYVLQCQLNIYFLQLITGKVESETYRSQDIAIKDVGKAKKFLKQLNASSIITGFAIISALIQAINCAINLSNDMDDSDEKVNAELEEFALVCRLFLWIFLIMVPFIQAARANSACKALSETGLVMLKPPVLFRGNTSSQNRLIKKNVVKITLAVKLFNVTIKPGFIYLAIITILLIFALRSGFQLFEQLL